jgi:hypothetical protein
LILIFNEDYWGTINQATTHELLHFVARRILEALKRYKIGFDWVGLWCSVALQLFLNQAGRHDTR